MERLSVENIERRKPVLDAESAERFAPDQMDQQWRLLTEAVRRDILTKPETRKIAAGYIASPVDESLPHRFLDGLSSDERVAKLQERYGDEIGDYLALASVPDDQINPDVSHSATLDQPEHVIERLRSIYDSDTPEYYQYLRECVESGMFLRGITARERLLVIQRYRFARDVKLLALQAEVAEQGGDVVANDRGEVHLPSGATIHINIEDEAKRQELLSPQNWEKRRQLKDRVYEIHVGPTRYILKEKKTARHTDTKEGGHKSGLSSLEEFQTAQHFRENGAVERGNIKVSWERPVASVTFPDGFQFTVFEHEEGLIEDRSITQALAQEILERREQFEDGFTAIRAMADTFKDDPKVLAFEHGNTESGLRAVLRWIGLRKEQIPDLTFEEFAKIKALRMEKQAKNLMRETITRNGCTNSDLDGFSYKINQKDGNIQLEIFGFDFEYFSKIDQDEVEEEVKKYQDFQRGWERRDGIGFLFWDDGSPVTRMQKAGYFALLGVEGLLQQKGDISPGGKEETIELGT